ncbi:hypothetical protein [Tolypothrix sp. VBCCA 56010]|uniref:hypothetical protein n=1 Tax=Tolypothrix sp. VBCCA 56010 TaxID=3137731 RepID=UPI003D7EE7EF
MSIFRVWATLPEGAIAPQSPYDVYIRTDIGGAYRFIRQTNQWLPLCDRLTLFMPIC